MVKILLTVSPHTIATPVHSQTDKIVREDFPDNFTVTAFQIFWPGKIKILCSHNHKNMSTIQPSVVYTSSYISRCATIYNVQGCCVFFRSFRVCFLKLVVL